MKKEFIEAMLKIQSELPVIKRNTDSYNYKYAPLEVIWEKVGTIINNAGFIVTNEVTSEGVITTVSHESGELKSFFPCVTVKPQDRGAEITYGRRYNLTAIFNIQLENEDNDAVEAQKKAPKQVNDISSL